jgi:hypothetical protein
MDDGWMAGWMDGDGAIGVGARTMDRLFELCRDWLVAIAVEWGTQSPTSLKTTQRTFTRVIAAANNHSKLEFGFTHSAGLSAL